VKDEGLKIWINWVRNEIIPQAFASVCGIMKGEF
jgi:hypothetical protein